MRKGPACNNSVKKRFSLFPAVVFFVFALLAGTARAQQAALQAADMPPAKIKSLPPAKIEVEGLRTISKAELIYLLGLRGPEQKALAPAHLARGIKRAFMKGIFEYISVGLAPGPSGENPGVIIVKVREKDRIRGICFNVKGNQKPSKGFLEDHFAFREGDFMRYGRLENAEAEARKTLSEAGYPEARVAVCVERITEGQNPYNVRLVVNVRPGKPLIVRKVKIIGPPVLPGFRFRAGDVFNQFKLRGRLAGLKKYYLERHYVSPRAGPYSFSDGVLSIHVKPGKRYEASFYGNHALADKKLKGLLPFMQAGDVTDALVREAAEKIRQAYREKGRPNAQVAPIVQQTGHLYKVKFFISEDGKFRVGKVDFTGVTLPKDRLRGLLALHEGAVYDPDLLATDRKDLENFYYSFGYAGASVAEPLVRVEGRRVDVTWRIKEGGRFMISRVGVQGASPLSESRVVQAIKLNPGGTYNDVDISNARYRVLELYNDLGYADCAVDVNRHFSGRSVVLVFTVKAGPKYIFGKNIIVGNRQTKEAIIRREFLHKPGDPFSERTVMKERQRLYQLGLFKSVDVWEMPAYHATFDTVYRVKESKPGSIEFGAGWGDYEKYRGFVGVSYKNLFGMDRLASARFEFSSLMRRVVANYEEPWFFGRWLPFKAFALAESRKEKNFDTGLTSYKLVRYTATAGVERPLGEHLKGQVYQEFSLVRTYDVLPGVILSPEDTGTLAISDIRPALAYDTRDNPFNPTSGVLAGASLKLASAAFLSQTDFVKFDIRAAKYQSLSKWLVLAGDARLGLAEGLGSTHELPIVERYFLGGRDSVRGYTQDSLGPKAADGTPIGGNAFFVSNLELRTEITPHWWVAPFLDAGNVWLTIGQIKPTDIRFSTGLGLNYMTPVGPIRIDYGIKLSRRYGESHSKIDFSIGHAF